jgi:hypothetical protein
MTMSRCKSLQAELQNFAGGLRPSACDRVSVLEVAHHLGSRVCVHLEIGYVRPSARIELAGTPPTIYITRPSPIGGERYLADHEEHLLTPRERFSVAHELGHLVAFRELQVPLARGGADYWMQEECMHAFAAALLVPERLVDDWLESVPKGQPVPPFVLRHWAKSIARLSEEVVATQLCLRRSDIGFMKVRSTKRQNDNARVLRVLFAASGHAMRLPKTHSHIQNDQLFETLESDATGMASLNQCILGRDQPQDIRVAWRHAGFLKHPEKRREESLAQPAPIYWLCAALQGLESSHQLPLW